MPSGPGHDGTSGEPGVLERLRGMVRLEAVKREVNGIVDLLSATRRRAAMAFRRPPSATIWSSPGRRHR